MDEKSNTNINIIGCGNSSEIEPNGGKDELEDLVKLLDIDSNEEYFNITDSDFLELVFNDSKDDQFQLNSSKHCRKSTKSVNTENKGKNTIDLDNKITSSLICISNSLLSNDITIIPQKIMKKQLLQITFIPILCCRY